MKTKLFIFICIGAFFALSCNDNAHLNQQNYSYPFLKTNNLEEDTLSSVFHIAIGDIIGNVRIRHDDSQGQEKPVLFAGLDYTGAWTRDGSINVWNGANLMIPDVSKNTLLELLSTSSDGKAIIGGQYWDNIIWTIGAWNYYLVTGDKEFLTNAYVPIINTLRQREIFEFDSTLNLFRGPAVYGDGISAYDDYYTHTGEPNNGLWLSNIDKWAEANPNLKYPIGVGMPMMVLSTNAVYYYAYVILEKIEQELSMPVNSAWTQKATKLKLAINTHLWNTEKNTYYYYIDQRGKCDYQEGMGLAFAILFDIASEKQRENIFKNTYVSSAGIPCVWPSFPRYYNQELQSYGRHSGTVWTHIQGFWAEAAAKYGKSEIFKNELDDLTLNTFRDKQFQEIYHPVTGLSYGGLQEDGYVKDSIREWKSTDRQTWGATAYIRSIVYGMFGLNISEKGIQFKPCIPRDYENLRLLGIHYRNAILNIYVIGYGTKVASFSVNEHEDPSLFIPKDISGVQNITIKME